MDPMHAYRVEVEAAAKAGNGARVFNGSPAHAQVVIETLFRNGANGGTARALSQYLANDVWGHPRTVEAVQDFLDRGGSVEIVVDQDLDRDKAGHNFFDTHFGRRATIRRAHPEHARDVPFHFLVVDGKSYRFEPDKHVRAAVAVFDDVASAGRLEKHFEVLRKYSRGLM